MTMKKLHTTPPPKLDALQLAVLTDTIEARIKQIEDGKKERDTIIQQIRKMHQDDYSHRTEDPNSIFKLSNVGVPMMKGVANSYAAKIEDEILSSDQPFQAEPRDADDKAFAEKFAKYSLWEVIEQIKFVNSATSVLPIITSEGTGIKKRSWRMDRSYFPAVNTYLHDASGQPVLDPDGNMISDDHPVTERNTLPIFNGTLSSGVTRLLEFDDHPPIKMNDEMQWLEVKEKNFVTHYDNAESCYVPFEDFLCDIKVSDIRLSPIVAHCYPQTLFEIWEKVNNSLSGDVSQKAFNASNWVLDGLEKIKNVQDGLPTGTSSTGSPAASLTQPMTHMGEAASPLPGILSGTDGYKTIQLAEVYIRYDVDDCGTTEDLVVFYERTGKNIILVDYLVNFYADCKLPFTVHGLYQVPGRWWSMGPYEYLKCAQDFVDRVFNRMNYRTTMSANPIGWSKPENFIDGKGPKVWGPGEKVQLKAAYRIEESMGFVQMPSLEQVEWQHFEFFISLVQLNTGVSNASQGDVSLPQSSTARGVETIVEEGNKLIRVPIRRLQGTHEEEIAGILRLIQQNLNEDRVFRFDKNAQTIIHTMTPDEIREIEFDVKIVMAKSGAAAKTQSLNSALQLVQTWIATPPEYQKRLRPLFIQLFNLIGIVDADTILPTDEELAQDQGNDQMLQQLMEKISAAAQQIAGGQLDPTKKVAQDLQNLLPMIEQMIAKPPPGAPGAAGQPQMPETEPIDPSALQPLKGAA